MARIVYAFPPVRVMAWNWVWIAPVNRSQSFFTGREFVSAAQRKRRAATLEISAAGCQSTGAGYMENLRMLIAGGENLVRLRSRPINRLRSDLDLKGRRQSELVSWVSVDDPSVEWSDGDPVPWLTGVVISGVSITDSSGFPALRISGGPPNTLIARPGEFLTLFESSGAPEGVTARVMTAARTDAAGGCDIRLMSALSGAGRVNIGTSESAIFRVVDLSESVQPRFGDWTYSMRCEEVFADEVGALSEVDPWR